VSSKPSAAYPDLAGPANTFSDMASLTVRAQGPARAPDVWEDYADPMRWPEWAPHIRRVVAIGRLRPGLTGQVFSVLPVPVSFEVIDVDAKRRRWSWKVAMGPVHLRFDHCVEPRALGASTWLTMHGPLALLLMYAPIARLALRRLVHTRAPASLPDAQRR
jgi:hypothetical protein